MPAQTLPPVARYQCAPETKEDIEYAAVPIIDFTNAHTPEGRAELAPQVCNAMRMHGFMCLVNHGVTQAQNDRMTDIADVPFSSVPSNEQERFASKTRELGELQGYKPRGSWHLDNGVRDQIQHYMVVHPTFEQQHPRALQPFLPEIHAFMEHNHFNIIHPILRMLALGLELPEVREAASLRCQGHDAAIRQVLPAHGRRGCQDEERLDEGPHRHRVDHPPLEPTRRRAPDHVPRREVALRQTRPERHHRQRGRHDRDPLRGLLQGDGPPRRPAPTRPARLYAPRPLLLRVRRRRRQARAVRGEPRPAASGDDAEVQGRGRADDADVPHPAREHVRELGGGARGGWRRGADRGWGRGEALQLSGMG